MNSESKYEQEEFKSNIERIMGRLKHLSSQQSPQMQRQNEFTAVKRFPSQQINEVSMLLRSKLETTMADHDESLARNLQYQLQNKIQELDQAQSQLIDYAQMKENYNQLVASKTLLESQLDQEKVKTEFLTQQLRVGPPKYDSDEILHLDSKLIGGSLKYNEIVTKFLVQSDDINRYKNEAIQLRTEVQEMHQELLQAKQRVQRLTQDLVHLKSTEDINQDLRNQLVSIKTGYTVITNDLEKANVQNKNNQEYIDNLEKEVDQLRGLLKERVTQIDQKHMNNLRKTTTESKDIVLNTMESLKTHYDTQLQNLLYQLEEAKKRNFNLEDQVTSLTTSLALCQSDIDAKKQQIDNLAFAVNNLENKLNEKEERIHAMKKDFAAQKHALEQNLADTIDAANQRNRQQEQKIAALIDQNKQLQNALHQQELHHKHKLAHHHQEANNDKNNEIQNVKTSMHNHHQHQLRQMQHALDEAHQKIHRLKTDSANQIQQLQAQIVQNLQNADKLVAENSNLKSQNDHLRDRIHKWKLHADDLKKEKEYQDVQIGVLIGNINDQINQLNQAAVDKANKDEEINHHKKQIQSLKHKCDHLEKQNEKLKKDFEQKNKEAQLSNHQLAVMIDSYNQQSGQVQQQTTLKNEMDQIKKKNQDLIEKTHKLEAEKAKQVKENEKQHKEIERLQRDLQMWQVNVQEMQKQPLNDATMSDREQKILEKHDREMGILIKKINEQANLIEVQQKQLSDLGH